MQKSFIKQTIVKLSAIGLLLGSFAANAGIVYQVDRSFGAGTIVGTIETNGTMGPLSAADIISFSFEAFDGTDVVTISSVAGFVQGEGWAYLSATATDLTFDFDGLAADTVLAGKYISFHGGIGDSFDYNLLANFVGKIEQLVHQSPLHPEHRVDSPARSGQVVIASTEDSSLDCSATPVKMGEVMAGFQAGFTGGSHTEIGNPAEFFMTLGGEARRGFVIPETGGSSAQCENDFILVSGFLGTGIETSDGFVIRTPKEAKDNVSSGFRGLIAAQRFEVDGVQIDHMNTAAKIAYHPNGNRIAVLASGIILEPYTLAPGVHSASVIYGIDPGRDGVVDFELPFTTSFTINAGPAQ